MFYFTTYFDKNYLSRGLVLFESLKEHCERFELYVLCLDDFTLDFFQKNVRNYPKVKTLSLNEIEEYDKELKKCKQNRSVIEYYFTLSPCLPLFLLQKYNLTHICSLDADMMFFSTPTPLFTYLENFSIVITPHKFSPELKSLEKYGIYNVSFQIFKNDEIGIACLEKWRNQCIEWCFDYVDKENSRFADQKYLDNWSITFKNKVKVLDDNVSGIAPWNLNNYQIRKEEYYFYSNGERIIFYHFHHFKFINSKLAFNGFYYYQAKQQKAIDELYLIYWNKVNNNNKTLSILKDKSTRYDNTSCYFVQLLKETTLYFKLNNRKLINVNFSWIRLIIKRILTKILTKINHGLL